MLHLDGWRAWVMSWVTCFLVTTLITYALQRRPLSSIFCGFFTAAFFVLWTYWPFPRNEDDVSSQGNFGQKR